VTSCDVEHLSSRFLALQTFTLRSPQLPSSELPHIGREIMRISAPITHESAPDARDRAIGNGRIARQRSCQTPPTPDSQCDHDDKRKRRYCVTNHLQQNHTCSLPLSIAEYLVLTSRCTIQKHRNLDKVTVGGVEFPRLFVSDMNRRANRGDRKRMKRSAEATPWSQLKSL
jgi:hypothetical protein